MTEIDEKILSKPFDKEEIKKILIDKFLPQDFNPQTQKIETSDIKLERIKEIELIGQSENPQIALFFIKHTGINDPRITITREAFKIIKNFDFENSIAVFYTDTSTNYRISLITFKLEKVSETRAKPVLSNPKRYSYFLGPDAKVHTPTTNLITKGRVKDEKDLKDRFSVEVVTKEFYQELANWYFWALKNVKFPEDAEKKPNSRNIALIRFITRIIFVWFMVKKKLIPEDLFHKNNIENLLKSLKDDETTYYTAILQNLFFATLNTKIDKRNFRKDDRYKGMAKDYMDHSYYRHHSFFKNPDDMLKIFEDIPFLNGGLFECLDKGRKDEDNETGEEIRIDGFSDTESKQPKFPNFLFFSDEQEVDLSQDYNNPKYEKTKVRGIINILQSYNFTIDENSPIDIEVSLDPELLGRVFENLLASYNPETATTARKATGSYYTPREIVDYMVEESLKNYLKTKLETKKIENLEEKLKTLFSYEKEENPFNTEQTNEIIELINNLKVIDPAVGSGAFPMGMLQKLVFLLSKLDPHNKKWEEKQLKKAEEISDPKVKKEILQKIEEYFSKNELNYGRKLYLIQNCLYGVDIQPIAIQIAKLRFFISLLVDEKYEKQNKENNFGIEPLPNLETKLISANTLIDLLDKDKASFSTLEMDNLENELFEIRGKYFFEPDRKKKDKLKKLDREKRLKLKEVSQKLGYDDRRMNQIVNWDPYNPNKSSDWFDPEWMFGIKNGFDIVIANPPYIQLQKDGGKLAKMYENKNYSTFTRTGDIYALFYEKGLNLLKEGGLLTYITSNKWMRAGYGEKLRDFFIQYNPLILIDLGPGVFENATVDTNILVIQKTPNQKHLKALTYTNKNLYISEELNAYSILMDKITKDAWFIGSIAEQSLKEKIERLGKPLKDWDVKIYYGIKTGLNDAFIIDSQKREEILNNCKDKSERQRTEAIIKPILRGRDIKRYTYEWAGLWVIGTFPALHLNIDDYPVIKKYFLNNFDIRQLEQSGKKYPELGFNARKKTGNKWFETQDQIAYYPEFEKEKVVWTPVNSEYSFTVLPDGIYFNNAIFMITGGKSKYFCTLFNSKLIRYYLTFLFSSEENYTYASKENMQKIPLPPITASNQGIVSQIEDLVDKILSAKKQNPQSDTTHLEREIDKLVYKLYDLTPDEIKIIEKK